MKITEFKSLVEVTDLSKLTGREQFNCLQRDNSFETSFTAKIAPSKQKKFTAEQIKEKAEAVGIDWVAGLENHLVQFHASDERPMATFKDIVLQNYNFDVFARNPVMLADHSFYKPPIGRHFSWGVTHYSDEAYKGPALILSGLFPAEGVSEQADHYRRLSAAGFLTASSITIMSRKVYRIEDPSERSKLGIGEYSLIYDENELIENSLVSVPEHPAAGIRKLSREHVLPSDFTFIRNEVRQTVSEDKWSEMEERLIEAARSVWPDIEFETNKPDGPVKEENQVSDISATILEGMREQIDGVNENIRKLMSRVNELSLSLEEKEEDFESVESDHHEDELVDADFWNRVSNHLNSYLDETND